MQDLFDGTKPAAPSLEFMAVEELLLLVGDEDRGCKPEAMDRLLVMGLEKNFPIFEHAIRNNDHADLRNGAMEVITRFGSQAVPKLIALLKDNDEEVRNFTTIMLGEIGSREAVGSLILTLRDTDVNVRHGAAEALGKICDPAALLPLLELLKEDFWAQYPAVAAIAAMKDNRAVPHLLQLLGNDLLAGAAIDALGEIGDPRALSSLGSILENSDLAISGKIIQAIVKIYRNIEDDCRYRNSPITRREGVLKDNLFNWNYAGKIKGLLNAGDPGTVKAAVTLLGWLGETAALPGFFLLLEDDDYQEPVERAILAMGNEAVPILIEALHHPSAKVRTVSVRSLRWLDDVKGLERVIQLIFDKDVQVQAAALESLKGATITGITPRLFELLEDSNEEVSTRSAEVLGSYPYAELQEFVQKMISSPDAARRRRVAALMGIMSQAVPPAIFGILIKDTDPLVRKEAIKGVGLHKFSKAFPSLRSALSDVDARVREEAVTAFAELGGEVPLQEIVTLLGSAGESLDCAIIRALGRIGSQEAGSALVRHLQKEGISRCIEFALIDALGIIGYQPAVPTIISCYLNHVDADIRRRAVQVLGEIADPDCLQAVEHACSDPHWSVRIASLAALVKIGGKKSLPVLLEAVKDPDQMVRKNALLLLGDLGEFKAISSLTVFLIDSEMGKYAFESLLKFGRTALPWLHRIMKGDFYQLEVRERVIALVGKIGDMKSVEALMGILDDPHPSIRLAAIDSLIFCFDSVPLKRLTHVMRSDSDDEVRKKALLALQILTMEQFFP